MIHSWKWVSLNKRVKDSPSFLETKRFLHANAFGISIAESNVDSFIEQTNRLYEQVEKEPVYWVDYIWTKSEVNPEIILNIAEHREIWGQEIPEPYICLKDIPLSSCQIQALA